MPTPQEIFNAAYGYSTKNVPQEVGEEATELFNYLNRILNRIYTIGGIVNPTFFGKSTGVAAPGAGLGWAEPTDALFTFRMEDPSGAEVIQVRIDERDAEPETPAVYALGRTFYPAGNTPDPDPASDALTFFYSKTPAEPADKDTALDSSWDDDFDELLVLQMALYLAHKDGRPEEYEWLIEERNTELNRFVQRLRHQYTAIRSAYGSTVEINTEQMETFRAMLGGGAS